MIAGLVVVLDLLFGAVLLAMYQYGTIRLPWLDTGITLTVTDIVLWMIRGTVIFTCVVLARHEIRLIFTRPRGVVRNMGLGLGRIAAVARTTMLEAWAGRIWILPVLWLVASFILIFSVRPFDESERIPLYIKMLLIGQEVLMLVIIWVMACVSLPRERERKTIVTSASKPISRLELLLGKTAGFSAITGVTLAIMCVASLIILYASDLRMRSAAREAYDIQTRDFARTMRTPNEGLKQLADEGSLFARNSITVARGDMSILGHFEPPSPDRPRPIRLVKGGSDQKIYYRFPRLIAPAGVAAMDGGLRPFFEFYFPIEHIAEKHGRVRIRVNAYVSQRHRIDPPKPLTKELWLTDQGYAAWEPDDPDALYSYVDPYGELYDQGEVTLEVQCLTQGVMLEVLDGGVVDADGVPPPGVEPNVQFFPVRFVPVGATLRAFWPDPNPVVRGFERRDRQEISGPKEGDIFVENAIYRFSGESLRRARADANGNFTMSFTLETYRGLTPTRPTNAEIIIFSIDNSDAQFRIKDKEISEKRAMRFDVPATYLGNSDPLKRGDLYVRVFTFTPGHSISLVEDSVRIELPQTPFFLNFIKGEFVVLLEAIVLITVCVVCSVRLGWPVAMFCSAVVVIFGFMLEFLVDLQSYGGLGALNYRSYGMDPKVFAFFDSTAEITWKILAVMARAVPNFTFFRYPHDFLPRLDNIPMAAIGGSLLDVVLFTLPVLAIGYLLFRKQELG
jgi:hypothetical protein